jgi:hypothetical protein
MTHTYRQGRGVLVAANKVANLMQPIAERVPGVKEVMTNYTTSFPPLEYHRRTRCKVCTPPAHVPNGDEVRRSIDSALLRGKSHQLCVDQASGLMSDWPHSARPSHDSVRRHIRHLPAQQVLARHLLETQAVAAGREVERGMMPLVTGLALGHMVIEQASEALARGEMVITMSDALAAAKFIDLVESRAGEEATMPLVILKLDAIGRTVREMLPMSEWPTFQAKVRSALAEVTARHGNPLTLPDGSQARALEKESERAALAEEGLDD